MNVSIMTKAELIAGIKAKNPDFKPAKKTQAVLADIYGKLVKPKKAKGEKRASRIEDGYRAPLTSEVSVPRSTSKRYVILQAMKSGTTIEELMKLTGWQPQTVKSALFTDVRSLGFGYDVSGAGTVFTLKDGSKHIS
jgi:hypothetical protein